MTAGGSTLYDARYRYNNGGTWDGVRNRLRRVEPFQLLGSLAAEAGVA